MSVVTGRRSCSISLIVRLDTPRIRASLSCVNPAAGNTSSRKISPGCVGLRFLLLIRLSLLLKILMVVFQVNIEGIFAFECECDAPVTADSDAPRTGAIAFELMQSITR